MFYVIHNYRFEERLEFEADILKSMSHENIVGYRDTTRYDHVTDTALL
mgnify:CR=1 FL=1